MKHRYKLSDKWIESKDLYTHKLYIQIEKDIVMCKGHMQLPRTYLHIYLEQPQEERWRRSMIQPQTDQLSGRPKHLFQLPAKPKQLYQFSGRPGQLDQLWARPRKTDQLSGRLRQLDQLSGRPWQLYQFSSRPRQLYQLSGRPIQ